MKLYTGPLSMFGHKVQIALAEKGIAFEIEQVPFSVAARYQPKHPEVIRINPKQQVPVLIDGDLELFDSTQIFEYLEDIAPRPALWPLGARARARARQFELKVDEVLFPHVNALLLRVARPLSNESTQAARDAILAFYADAEALLDEHEYLVESFSYADIALFMASTFASFAGGQRIPGRLTRLHAWQHRTGMRPSVHAVVSAAFEFLRAQGVAPVAV